MNLNTEMELPTNRDTVLHFFEQMKKGVSRSCGTSTRGRTATWCWRETRRRSRTAGWRSSRGGSARGTSTPSSLEDAYRQHEMVLDLAPPLLTISLLDCEALDVMFGFDFTYDGNHDEVVAEALGVGPRLEGLLELPRARVINFEPSLTLALDESCQLQCRLSIETRTNAYQVRTGRVRRRPDQRLLHGPPVLGDRARSVVPRSFRRQREIGEEILQPHRSSRAIVRPAGAGRSRSR